MGARLFLGGALGVVCLCPAFGCGGGAAGDKPAQFSPEVLQKNRDKMSGGYRASILADRKTKSSAKGAAPK
jgi:hypothetical protein